MANPLSPAAFPSFSDGMPPVAEILVEPAPDEWSESPAFALAGAAALVTICLAVQWPSNPVPATVVAFAAALLFGVAIIIFGRSSSRLVQGRRREEDLRIVVATLQRRDDQADEHAASLTLRNQELAHRYRNCLALVQVVADRTLAQSSDLPSARLALSERIRALDATTSILASHDCGPAPLDAVVRAIVGPHDPDGVRIVCAGPSLLLPPRMVLGMALMLHELATNAVKYGALSQQGGHVELRWSTRRSVGQGAAPAGAETLRLSWQERDGPTVSPPARSGFGTTLIEKAAAAYFRGRGELSFKPEGLDFVLNAPLPVPSEWE